MENKKILILLNDKDPVLTRISKLKIEHETGWEAIIPASFNEAIEQFTEKNPNVVVTEIMLNDTEGRSGFDFIESIKRISTKKDLQVIILTNLSQEEDKQKSRDLGVAYYFVKSEISLKSFIEELRKILEAV